MSHEAVLRVVEAARSLVGDRALEDALVVSTGLSREGVKRAFARHLETDPTPAEVAALARAAGEASEVAVVLSANVFVGALRAIALARATASRVVVRPSRREPAFATALVEALRAHGEEGIVLDPALRIEDVAAGEIHVYGRDETITEVRAQARPGVRVRGHGSGMGVAWVSARAGDAEASALADDVVAFDQQGCLSPRIVLVEGEDEAAESFADALHRALLRAEAEVPRGQVPDDVQAAIATWRASMEYAGRVRAGTTHAVAVAQGFAALPPTHRHVLVVPVEDTLDGRALLAPVARAVVAVGSDDLSGARALAPAWARLSPLGAMQRPRLDGPVDRRDT